MSEINKGEVIAILNKILETELAGVVRYTHYSLMIFGHSRIPIIGWMKEQANESLLHASQAGEHVTSLGGHPSLKIGPLLESEKHSINDILAESLEHERNSLKIYYELLDLVKDKSVWIQEYAEGLILEEEMHIAEVEKMMRNPGDLKPAR